MHQEKKNVKLQTHYELWARKWLNTGHFLPPWKLLYAIFAAIPHLHMWLILRNYGKPSAFHHLCINKMPNQACWMKGQPLIYLQQLVEDCSNTYDNQTFVINKICKRKGKNLQIWRIWDHSSELESSKGSSSGMVGRRETCRTNPRPPNKGLM